MTQKTVLHEIEVPSGKYCWEHFPPHSICEHFDNEGGHATCGMGFDSLDDLKQTQDGVLKSPRCAALPDKKTGGFK